ncbi:hypothetical protein D3C86_1374820 [compost metagenome]
MSISGLFLVATTFAKVRPAVWNISAVMVEPVAVSVMFDPFESQVAPTVMFELLIFRLLAVVPFETKLEME